MPKRAFDLGMTLVLAPIALAVIALAAAATAVDLHGNPFFLQRRIGLNGRPFTMFKLRTMHHSSGNPPSYAVDDWDKFVFSPPGVVEPRLTRLGAFMRRTSIDELPNLLNVLTGRMSIVGPRPEIPEIVRQYPAGFHRRHEVRPGITGLAQVRGRSDLAYADIIKYDLAYVDKHSFFGDLRIIGETLRTVLCGLGAR